MRISAAIVLLVLGYILAACDHSGSPSVPSPSPALPAPPAPLPVPQAPLNVSHIAPNQGSTAGDTPVTLTGSGFQPGATVTFGDTASRWKPWVQSSTTIQVTTPAHGAGTLDVIVTNPNGQVATVADGYSYAPPDSFDFNGIWEGGAGPEGWEYTIRFAIQNNIVGSVSCGASGAVTLSPAPSISNGEFSFVRGASISVSGRIVAASVAIGKIDLPPCTTTNWWARKQ